MEVSDAMKSAVVKVIATNQPSPSIQSSDVTEALAVEGNDLMVAYFKLNKNDITTKDIQKLNEIYSYAKVQTGDDKELGILEVLRELRFRLGEPKGMSEVDHLHKYITLKSQAKKLRDEVGAMES
jgi:hypothetical protein